jgi:hypothetical protein
VSDVLSANAYPTLTMSPGRAVAGMLLPWGLAAGRRGRLDDRRRRDGIRGRAGPLGGVGHLASVSDHRATVFLAYAIERSRVERFCASEALADSKAHAEEEAQVASVLVRVARLGARLAARHARRA